MPRTPGDNHRNCQSKTQTVLQSLWRKHSPDETYFSPGGPMWGFQPVELQENKMVLCAPSSRLCVTAATGGAHGQLALSVCSPSACSRARNPLLFHSRIVFHHLDASPSLFSACDGCLGYGSFLVPGITMLQASRFGLFSVVICFHFSRVNTEECDYWIA